jgi:hypothetical protein
VSQVKLIAEPWDIGEGGYQVGNFPPLWSEWNGRYRDTIRDFWRGEPATLAEFGYRFTGSSDLYQADTRGPTRRSTSSPPTTASRCATSSPTTRSTTRPTARTTRRRVAQPLVELRRRGRHRRQGGASPCAPASGATSSPRCCCRRACRCCSAATRSGRTQQRQQQRLLPGQRALVVRLGDVDEDVEAWCRRSPTSAASTRSSAAAHGSRGGRIRGVEDLGVVPLRRRGDGRGRLGDGVCRRASGRLPQRRVDHDDRHLRWAASSTTASS